jgi:hypothetical protein
MNNTGKEGRPAPGLANADAVSGNTVTVRMHTVTTRHDVPAPNANLLVHAG